MAGAASRRHHGPRRVGPRESATSPLAVGPPRDSGTPVRGPVALEDDGLQVARDLGIHLSRWGNCGRRSWIGQTGHRSVDSNAGVRVESSNSVTPRA